MDPTVMVVGLIIAMTVSGGVMGAFWLRALTIMRRQIIDSADQVERLADVLTDLQGQVDGLGEDNRKILERLEFADRLLDSGDQPHSTTSDRAITPT